MKQMSQFLPYIGSNNYAYKTTPDLRQRLNIMLKNEPDKHERHQVTDSKTTA